MIWILEYYKIFSKRMPNQELLLETDLHKGCFKLTYFKLIRTDFVRFLDYSIMNLYKSSEL